MASRQTLERRLAAIVSADITGYGLLMAADENDTHRRVGNLINSLTRRVGQFGGSVITIAGDGILAEFPSPVTAVRFSIVLQQDVQRRNVRLNAARQIGFRVGIHVGDVVLHAGQLGGDDINIAVRIEQIAEPHTIFLSQAVYEQVHRRMPLQFAYVGEPRLKNVTRPVRVYRVVKEDPGTVQKEVPLREKVGPPRIAVLPFENLSANPGEDFLVRGITDDIITGLSRFRSLAVIGRRSSFQYARGQVAAAEIAGNLGVRYLLTGTIRKSGRRIRLTAQLSDTGSDRTIWAENYDATLNAILAIEDAVVQVIVARLVGQLEGAERVRALREETADLEAYSHVLQGEELLLDHTREKVLLARKQFELAIDRDHDYARAYSGLSRTYNLEWRYSWVADREAALDRAEQLAKQAIAKDPMDARAHAALGFAVLYKKEVERSVEEYGTALRLNPNDADVMAGLADALLYDDNGTEAVQWMKRALELNPLAPDWYYWHLADAYSSLGQYEMVIATVQRMNDPGLCSRLMAVSFAHLGRLEEAHRCAEEVLRRQPGFRISEWARVIPHSNKERLSRFVDGLRRAGLPD